MFCPKCGAENPETNKYCRACREDLQMISQVMKNRLPVVIASKVDQILDSRSERFRRDSLLNSLMFLSVLTGCLISLRNGLPGFYSDTSFYLLVSFLALSSAIQEYRAYRRSLAPDFDWTAIDQDHVDILNSSVGSVATRINGFLKSTLTSVFRISPKAARSETEGAVSVSRFEDVSIPSITESTTRQLDPSVAHSLRESDIIYCPRCGAPGDRMGQCGVCGVSLDLIAKAIQPREQDARRTKLDRYIRKKTNALAANDQKFHPTVWWFFLGVSVFALARSGSTPVGWYNMALAISFLVSGTWDRIAHRRNTPEPKPEIQVTKAAALTSDPESERAVFSQDGRVLRIGDPAPRAIELSETRPIHEWQKLYPHFWMLIEVTREDESGVSEGKLVTVAEDAAEFRDAVLSDRDRYLVAIHGSVETAERFLRARAHLE